MTTSGPENPTPDPDADEVARLREEVARLKAGEGDRRRVTVAVGGGRSWPVCWSRSPRCWHPLSVLSTWASGQIQDTDRYLETVAPLANDPDVQAAIVVRVEQVIYSYLDLDAAVDEVVTALEDQGLPPTAATTLSALASPLTNGIRGFIHDRITALVASDAFETAWVEANRTAHSELVAALTGKGDGAVEIDKGTVSVNLAVLINTLKGQLVEAGFGIAERIPEVAASFTIVQSDDLATLQNLLGVLDNLSTWIPVVGLGLLAAAVAVSRDRRRWVLVSGLAVAGSMLLLGATLNAIRPIYLDALPESSSPAAAGAIYDQLVSFIRMALRGVGIVGLAVAVVAWFSAPRGAGAAARRGLVGGIDGLRRGTTRAGLKTGKLGLTLGQYRGPIRVAVVGIAAVGYLAQDHPTGGTALAFLLGTAVVLLVLAVLAADPEDVAEDEAEQTVPVVP